MVIQVKIKDIVAREVLDSRGNPTVEVDTILYNGIVGRYAAPSGASTGSREAYELRDNDKRYHKKGVLKVVDYINNELKYEVINGKVNNQRKIDMKLIKKDGTKNKHKYGGNALTAMSLSILDAGCKNASLDAYKYVGSGNVIPRIMVNIINGGMHANNNLTFQEFMIIPIFKKVKEQIRASSEVFHTLKEILKNKGYNTSVGDEGGFAPNLKDNKEALDLIVQAIKKSGYEKNFYIGIDAAANSFYDGKNYIVDNKQLSTNELLKYYSDLVNKYPIISIEDPFYENDYKGFKEITRNLGSSIQIVGDDLYVTNKELLKKGIKNKYTNAILIKPNQVGTYTEMLETIKLAKQNKIKTIISHRSGETESNLISHFAVGLNLGQIKCGSMSRLDRISKYNELIRIEEKIDC